VVGLGSVERSRMRRSRTRSLLAGELRSSRSARATRRMARVSSRRDL